MCVKKKLLLAYVLALTNFLDRKWRFNFVVITSAAGPHFFQYPIPLNSYDYITIDYSRFLWNMIPFSTMSCVRRPPSIPSQPSSIYSILVYMVYMYIRIYISIYYLAYRNVSCPHPPPPSYMYQRSLFPLNSGLSPHFCMFWALPFVIEPFLRCLVILGCLLALNCRRRDILSVTWLFVSFHKVIGQSSLSFPGPLVFSIVITNLTFHQMSLKMFRHIRYCYQFYLPEEISLIPLTSILDW